MLPEPAAPPAPVLVPGLAESVAPGLAEPPSLPLGACVPPWSVSVFVPVGVVDSMPPPRDVDEAIPPPIEPHAASVTAATAPMVRSLTT
ncbi:MAG: hypothetical protein FJ027_09105 [Candidatus Rokubacteria bacterium]|nr:hypothetical protein [Candidatus Rokubacteria bacterium]